MDWYDPSAIDAEEDATDDATKAVRTAWLHCKHVLLCYACFAA